MFYALEFFCSLFFRREIHHILEFLSEKQKKAKIWTLGSKKIAKIGLLLYHPSLAILLAVFIRDNI